ncbi:ficolin-1-like isoform X2 [Anneissia japonica]|uniref:ficolin-1-like isoform X2 n=1 Tax=Anneissia japonica TaxID=1529436 RepID=UPI0014259BE3|nr:ficolin-1-like isoform X2 [Anneissia japonica]
MMFYKFMLILAIFAANIPANKGLISCTKSVIFTKYGFRPMSAEDTTILTTKAGSATQCTQFCLSHVQCQSIVYHDVTRLCELLSSLKQHDHKNTETGHVQYNINYQVIQRRRDIIVDFNQPWEEFKNGFGNLCGDMWIGNQFLHEVTTSGEFKLRLDLEGIDGNTYHVTHNSFKILDESQDFKLNIGEIIDGNAGGVFNTAVDMRFSTKDRDNDLHNRLSCANDYRSGWWYKKCFICLPNGRVDVNFNCKINDKKLEMKMAEMKIKNYG